HGYSTCGVSVGARRTASWWEGPLERDERPAIGGTLAREYRGCEKSST
ncbi:MAG: hypothetical protein ACI9AD_001215, partial [Nitriliruptoraceae bacterium]